MKCSCNEWKENIDLVNGCIQIASIHNSPYAGKQFANCPWCGKKLMEEVKENDDDGR